MRKVKIKETILNHWYSLILCSLGVILLILFINFLIVNSKIHNTVVKTVDVTVVKTVDVTVVKSTVAPLDNNRKTTDMGVYLIFEGPNKERYSIITSDLYFDTFIEGDTCTLGINSEGGIVKVNGISID